ncbi:hypothetical protein B0H11DRAFT_271514 [Mycena galericulata]|nr:hypothetical protein B0H11DRAFT_271514 [Mycena galericulata]
MEMCRRGAGARVFAAVAMGYLAAEADHHEQGAWPCSRRFIESSSRAVKFAGRGRDTIFEWLPSLYKPTAFLDSIPVQIVELPNLAAHAAPRSPSRQLYRRSARRDLSRPLALPSSRPSSLRLCIIPPAYRIASGYTTTRCCMSARGCYVAPRTRFARRGRVQDDPFLRMVFPRAAACVPMRGPCAQ